MNDTIKNNIKRIIKSKNSEIRINVIENKILCKKYYEEVKYNYKLDSVLYFYTMPDFYLYKLTFKVNLNLKCYNNKEWWYSVYYPYKDSNLYPL
jgi:hypothetical protein